MRSFIRTNIK